MTKNMTKIQIKEGNKLIANFMDLFPIESIRHKGVYMLSKHRGNIWYRYKDDVYEQCKYHKSWDWLMPVVEKIGSTDLSGVDIHWGTGCTDSFAWCDINWDNNKKSFHTSDNLNSDEQSLITAVWFAVVEFIKWYNKNK
jgi:hypothetical protein